MSRIVASLEENILTIRRERARIVERDVQEIDIRTLKLNKKYTSKIQPKSKEHKNQIFFWQEMEIGDFELTDEENIENVLDDSDSENLNENADENSIVGDEENQEEAVENKHILFVISTGNRVHYGYMKKVQAYKLLLRFIYKVLSVNLKNGYLNVRMLSYLVNTYDVQVDSIRFSVDEKNWSSLQMNAYPAKISKRRLLKERNYQHIKLPLKDMLTDETKINNMLNVMVTVDGVELDFRIGKKNRKMKNSRKYYAPYKSCYFKGYAIHVRRTVRGNFAIVKRPMEAIEHTLWFKFMESKVMSFLLYNLGKLVRKVSSKKINLFYEKFAEKAEEGTFDLFIKANEKGKASNYFIIDSGSTDYAKIKHVKHVVKKYSLKYYWLIYRVNNYIATEAPAHLNILRSNNKYFRLCTCEHPFIFLQHGVTYLKCQGTGSTFVKGKEGEPAYIIVGSEKEKDVVCDMLNLPEERVLNTGLPIFSKIEYGQMSEKTPDKVVIMLTWKSYEEHIEKFENSQYYKNVMEVYHMLEKYIASEDIIIVPHPKMAELCENTSLKETMWNQPISEVLNIAKLLITDYSSVCYNSFYQGGGVLFYQPDLDIYEKEVGRLIPTDEEYIGGRAFDIDTLEQMVSEVITDGTICLEKLREQKYIDNYQSINEFSDGKNIDRIAEELVRLEII